MKNLLFIMMVCFSISMSLSSCGGEKQAGEKKTEQIGEAGKEYTSTYICPMHCEGSGSDVAGDCPVCGMAYVENTGKKEGDGHNHDGHNHDGHNHEGHNH